MGFKFSLGTVLRLRESIEKREEITLQTIQLEIAQLRRTIDELTVEIDRGYEVLQGAMQRPLEARLLQLMLVELNGAVGKRQDLLLKLEVSLQKQSVQLKAFRSAARARQILTEMRIQKRAEFDEQQQRIQQNVLDEIFTARFQGH